jgi:hypothetical protein
MPYGISKLGNLQFQVSALDYATPLGAISGKILTWAFLGYCPWFQFLLGALEAVPGVLLCFRRTWRIGALLLMPVLVNVVLMNFAMDLWQGTKQISAVLLFLNIVLVGSDAPRYVAWVKALLRRPVGLRRRPARVVASIAEVVIVIALVAYWSHDLSGNVSRMMAQKRDFIGVRQINSAGSWSVNQLTVAGKETGTASNRFLYFDFGGRCRFESGEQRLQGRFKAEAARHTFEISGIPFDGNRGTITGTYAVQGDELVLDGRRDDGPVHVVLRRWRWGRQLPY